MNLRGDGISFLIGIDVGTTSIKGILISGKGEFVCSSVEEYELDYGPDGVCELDAEIYWSIMCKIIRNLIQLSGVCTDYISGIAISSQGETLILVDINGIPLRKAIIWLDNRSVKEAKLIEEQFGLHEIQNVTGQAEVVSAWPATRILWIRENETEIFNRTSKFLLVEDFLLYRLTGKYCTEHSLVSSTLYFDIVNKKWWEEMLGFIKISEYQLPDLYESGIPLGHLTEIALGETGLGRNTICVTGGYDHPSGAIGAGNITHGSATVSIGTSMAMCITLDKIVMDTNLKLPCQCHVIPGMYFLLPYIPAAGLVLKWFKEEFCTDEITTAARLNTGSYDIMVRLAEEVPAGSEGLLTIPHFMGTGSPCFNENFKGAFAGITPKMTKGHFIRSIMEGVVCSIKHNIEVLIDYGVRIKDIRSIGGGAKSALWNQMIADMTGVQVVTMMQEESGSLGAAILAGKGIGVFESITEGSGLVIKVGNCFVPNFKNSEVYKKVYERYLNLYNSIEMFSKNQ